MNAFAELAARETACGFVPSSPSGRFSSQARPDIPEGVQTSPHPRAIEMAETIRELVFRDGNATEAALVAEGYTSTEIVELGADASRRARQLMVSEGAAPDDIAAIVEKSVTLVGIPSPGGFVLDRATRQAWGRYVKARRAHALDPWIGQQSRCTEFLRAFLRRLPILDREVNRVLTSTVGAMKRIEEAGR